MRTLTMLPLIAVTTLLASGCDDDMLRPGPTEAVAQAAPAPDRADGRRQGFRVPGHRGGQPLARVLERRTELALTADQVARLEALAAELKGEHEALRSQVQAQRGERPDRLSREELRDLTDEQRSALREEARARREALRPMMEQARASRAAAMAEVREILTDEQEAKLGARQPGRVERRR